MRFTKCIADVAVAATPEAFRFASENIDSGWIEEALAATGRESHRLRKLPAAIVVWLVIAMALFRDRSIAAVVSHLQLARDKEALDGRGTVAPAAIAQARARLGSAPVKVLFHKTADIWTAEAIDQERWNGLVVFAGDGTTVAVPDTPENHEHFGRPKSGRSIAGYPQVRVMALSLARSHLVADMAVGPCKTSEQELALDLWGRIPSNSVTILDRNFLAFGFLYRFGQGGEERHWLVRAKCNTRWKTVRSLGPGDELVELKLSSKSRKEDAGLPRTIVVRAIHYQRPGFRPQFLLTSLLDPTHYPAQEVVVLYHERWEIEIGFDEKKTHMLERKEALRSKKPGGVEQELWGLAIAYNLIRLMMARVAQKKGVPPRRISFWNSLLAIRAVGIAAWWVPAERLPDMLERLTAEMGLMVLPQRRGRSNPRVIKVKMSKFKKKPAPAHATRLK
jgi:hypothetical protein